MIEDRLLSILAHAGFAQRCDDSNPSWSKKNKEVRRALYISVDKKHEASAPRIKAISTKVMTLKALCLTEIKSLGFETPYAQWLDNDVRKVLTQANALELCERIESWHKARNIYVHAMFGNIEYKQDDEDLKAFAEQGKAISTDLKKLSTRIRTAEGRFEKRKAAYYRKANAARGNQKQNGSSVVCVNRCRTKALMNRG